MEWMLVSCGLSFTVEDTASPSPNPVLSQDHPAYKDRQAEPTTGRNKHSTVALEPAPLKANEDHIASESEQQAPDQVCKPARHQLQRECLWNSIL